VVGHAEDMWRLESCAASPRLEPLPRRVQGTEYSQVLMEGWSEGSQASAGPIDRTVFDGGRTSTYIVDMGARQSACHRTAS